VEAVIQEEDANEDYEIYAFITRPEANPLSESIEEAHFYDSDATSTFALIRQGTKVMAAEFGRNELPNTDAAKGADKARNMLLSAGAFFGFAAAQWKLLMKGILKEAE
jgi:hypothetical protein